MEDGVLEQPQEQGQLCKHNARLIKCQNLTEGRAQNKPNARQAIVLTGCNNVICSLEDKHTPMHFAAGEPRGAGGLLHSFLAQDSEARRAALIPATSRDKYFGTFPRSV